MDNPCRCCAAAGCRQSLALFSLNHRKALIFMRDMDIAACPDVGQKYSPENAFFTFSTVRRAGQISIDNVVIFVLHAACLPIPRSYIEVNARMARAATARLLL